MPAKIPVNPGERYGRLVIIKEVEGKRRSFLCKCDCGTEKTIQLNHLRSGLTQSCGCYQVEQAHNANVVDLTRKRFGRLVVIRKTGDTKGASVEWECQCDCGKTKLLGSNELLQAGTKSCGCLLQESIQVARSKLYNELSVEGVQIPSLKKKVRKDSESGHKGIYFDKHANTHKAYITVKGKQVYLGSRKHISDAILLRQRGEKLYHEPYIKKLKESEKNQDG